MSHNLIIKCLNETTEVVGDIKRPHSEYRDSSSHQDFDQFIEILYNNCVERRFVAVTFKSQR